MPRQGQAKSLHTKNRKRENGPLYQQLRQQERQEKEERLRFLEVLSESISLPPDVLTGAPIVTMHGRNAVFIENHKKISTKYKIANPYINKKKTKKKKQKK